MLTAIAATLLTITTATPAAAPANTPTANVSGFSKSGTTTLATALPTPGAWALMGMGGLALIRSRRDKR
jgi:MYXO-CTERM domain-containing protein